MTRTHLEWMDLHADVLIPHAKPRFFLGRTPQGNVCRVADDVPISIATKLVARAKDEPILNAPEGRPVFADAYVKLLSEAAPVCKEALGPAYHFPAQILTHSHEVVQVTQDNRDLLQPNHSDWTLAIGHRDPVCVLLMGGKAVSICFSPAISDLAHEAGVDTLEAYRGNDYAVFVVASWASLVRKLGMEPLYSTSSNNLASQAVALKLGLVPIGLDYHLT